MTELSGKRIVMTGATGFIGSHVAKRFLEAGAEVYCLVRPESQKTDCLPVHEHLHRIPAQLLCILSHGLSGHGEHLLVRLFMSAFFPCISFQNRHCGDFVLQDLMIYAHNRIE